MTLAYSNGNKTRSASIVELTGETCDDIAQLLFNLSYFINKEMQANKENVGYIEDLEAMYQKSVKTRDLVYKAIANRK